MKSYEAALLTRSEMNSRLSQQEATSLVERAANTSCITFNYQESRRKPISCNDSNLRLRMLHQFNLLAEAFRV